MGASLSVLPNGSDYELAEGASRDAIAAADLLLHDMVSGTRGRAPTSMAHVLELLAGSAEGRAAAAAGLLTLRTYRSLRSSWIDECTLHRCLEP